MMLVRDFLFYWQVLHFDDGRLVRNAAWQTLKDHAPLAELQLSWLTDEMQASLQDEQARRQARAAYAHTPFITRLDPAYPPRLAEAWQPPAVLFYQGDLGLLATLNLAVVGARKATAYTQIALATLAQSMPPVTIVSGLAVGADGMAHRWALKHQWPTIAVIATGLDRYFPSDHVRLQQQIAQVGLVLSEYPPGVFAKPKYFVERNRIIAGLAHGLLVTEAAMHSGSLITANLALQNDREVFALPNRIEAPLGVGTNALIQAGAKPVMSGTDIMEDLRFYP